MATIEALPNELLIAILAFVDPATPFRRRPCSTLYVACLVSKRWRECAQPLLWQAIDTSRLQAILREAKADGLGGYARSLDVVGQNCENEVARVRPLLDLGNLTDVRVEMWPPGPQLAELFPLLSNLNRIVLCKVNFLSCITPSIFSCLVSLSIHNAFARPAFLESLLQPHHVPHLRLLLLGQLYQSFNNRFFPSLDKPFLRQLDLLQLEIQDKQPQIFLSNTFTFAPLPTTRLLLRLRTATTSKKTSRTAVATISSPWPTPLLEECAKRETKVLWEDGAYEEDDGWRVSEEFHRWVLKKRRDEGA
ncbi:hypothetical protein JCM6882_004966 [Rhodosporidiobolus microsporus]